MMSRTKSGIWCALLAVFLTATGTVAPTQASQQGAWKQVIIKCDPEDLDRVRNVLGGTIVDAGHGYYLVTVSASVDLSKIDSIRGKGPIEVEDDEIVVLQRRAPRSSATSGASGGSLPSLGASVDYFGTPARQGYIDQPAAGKIQLKQALNIATGSGIRVAIIDTGIDERHPTLKSIIFGGKNYVGWTTFPSERDDRTLTQSTAAILDQSTAAILDQSTAAILDQSTAAILDQSTAAILDQSTAAILDQSTAAILDQLRRQHPAYGHGTMMAGLAHLVAPHAKIIPLKTFDATGASTEWNIIRAIYDAVDMGADVISMSFSTSEKNKLIQTALRFATSRGVAVVGSAGNDNSESPTYPASLEAVIGVCALDLNDQKAPFSNFGRYVDLCAPGVDLITTYPGGRWALVSGTSHAVPWVSGVLSLVKQRGARGAAARERVEETADSLNVPLQYRNKLGAGRVNAYNAVARRNDSRRD